MSPMNVFQLVSAEKNCKTFSPYVCFWLRSQKESYGLSGRASALQEEGPRFHSKNHLLTGFSNAGTDFCGRSWRTPNSQSRQHETMSWPIQCCSFRLTTLAGKHSHAEPPPLSAQGCLFPSLLHFHQKP